MLVVVIVWLGYDTITLFSGAPDDYDAAVDG